MKLKIFLMLAILMLTIGTCSAKSIDIIASADVGLNELNPNTNYGHDETIVMGNGINNFALLLFDVDEIPKETTITSAVMYLYQSENNGITNFPIQVHNNYQTWFEYTSTGQSIDQRSARYPMGEAVFSSGSNIGWRGADITNMVKLWYGGEENKGIMLRDTSEMSRVPTIVYDTYNSRESSENQPFLRVTYTTNPIVEIIDDITDDEVKDYPDIPEEPIIPLTPNTNTVKFIFFVSILLLLITIVYFRREKK